MKLTSAIALVLALTSPALAHTGHVADNGSGHTHWLALAAFGGIAVIALALFWRRRRLAAAR